MSTGPVELQGITIVAPVKATLQGLDYRRNILKGVTIAVGTGAQIMQLKVVDRNHEPIEGATCRVLNAITSNNVLSFDGVNDYAETANFVALSNQWTVEAWVNPSKSHSTGSVNTQIVGGIDVTNSLPFYLGYKNALSNNNVGIFYNDGQWRACFAATSPALNEWTHVAGVRDGSSLKIYINGVLSNFETRTTNAPNSTMAVRIGRRHDSTVLTNNVFGGKISEARVWSVAKTIEQINELMNVRLAGDETNLAGYWPLNDGEGSLANETVASRDATIYGATWQEVEGLPILNFKGQYDTTTPYDSQTTNANGLTTLNYQINTLHGLEVTLPGKRRFIMPFNRERIQYLEWQVMLSNHLATFLTDNGELLINANPQDNDNNFLLEA